MKRAARLAQLEEREARRRKEAAGRRLLPLSEVFAYLLDVLNIVREEAGTEAVGRVAGRMIGEKLRRVDVLSRGQQ